MNDVRDYQDKIDRYREEHPDMHYLYRYYNDEALLHVDGDADGGGPTRCRGSSSTSSLTSAQP